MTLVDSYRGVFDGQVGFGTRPALLLVDFVRAYTTPGEKLYAPDVARAAEATVTLLAAARARAVPVLFTRVLYHASGRDGGMFVRKVPLLRSFVATNPMTEIVPELAPRADEVVLIKQYASSFFATPLASMLTALGVDTLVITGCSTSGCVRATAVDACQHGFRAIVPRECVGDRHSAPHEANLFDIHGKYGDVVEKASVLAHFETLTPRPEA
jgi:maleamate amidohydrolase